MVTGVQLPSFQKNKLSTAETKYCIFDRELLAMYLAIKHFRHFVEGQEFHILADHKPLTFALSTKSTKLTPRQCRHLDYISQFTLTFVTPKAPIIQWPMHCHAWTLMLFIQTQTST